MKAIRSYPADLEIVEPTQESGREPPAPGEPPAAPPTTEDLCPVCGADSLTAIPVQTHTTIACLGCGWRTPTPLAFR